MSRVRDLLKAGNVTELKTKGHNMKGTAASYGFPDLTRLGAAIEQAARASDLQQLGAYVDEMERYVVRADDFLSAKQEKRALQNQGNFVSIVPAGEVAPPTNRIRQSEADSAPSHGESGSNLFA